MIPQEVRDLAAGIADDIEEFGHYQGDNPRLGRCCLIVGPAAHTAPAQLLYDQLGRRLPFKRNGDSSFGFVNWNDQTPTPVVLATLRKIAAGETP